MDKALSESQQEVLALREENQELRRQLVAQKSETHGHERKWQKMEVKLSAAKTVILGYSGVYNYRVCFFF